MSDEPQDYQSDETLMEWAAEYCEEMGEPIYANVIRKRERLLNFAVDCINAVEAHYRSKHGESYEHTTLHTIIENWRNK